MSLSRKDALRTFALFPTFVAADFVFPDEVKTSKAAVHYQDSPKYGQLCATCLYYVAGSGSSGTCKIVEGSISPKAWCSNFAAKIQNSG
jgi:hypothetical protein